MSELDKHYGADAADLDRDAATSRGAGEKAGKDAATGILKQAEDSLKDVRDGAARAADRVRDTVSDGYDRAQDWAHEGYESLSRNAVYARRRSAAEFNRSRRSVAAFVDENPIMVGVAGLAAGLLIGSLLPGTRRENRLIGSYADDVRREGMRYARDMADQGREALAENLRAMGPTKDTASR